MELNLSAEHLALQAAVRDFAQSVVKPMAERTDREHRFPREAIAAASELDLMGILIPAEYGGAGLDHLAFTLCIEEIAAACASTAVIVDVHNSVAAEPILLFGTEDQKRRWLPPLARGDLVGAFALTEPSSGSDAGALKTTARRRGDTFVLNGTKVFITIVGEAGLYIIFARTGPEPGAAGVSAFLVPGDTPGLRPGQIFTKMGQVYETELRDLDKAIESYNDVLSVEAEHPAALAGIARLYEETSQWDQAVEVMRRRLREAARECQAGEHYDYLIINDDLDETVEVTAQVCLAARHRQAH